MLLYLSPSSIRSIESNIRGYTLAQETNKLLAGKIPPDIIPPRDQCLDLHKAFVSTLAFAKRPKNEEAQKKSQEELNVIFALLSRCPEVTK